MITTVPSPRWLDLLRPAQGKIEADRLAVPWQNARPMAVRWYSRSAWSLAMIAKAWHNRHGAWPRLAVPAYFCEGSLAPVRAGGVQVVRYRIDPFSLQPLVASLPQADLVVGVHYFGRPCDLAALRDHCDRHRALLIEDAAHATGPEGGIGTYGDMVLYSPHKILPVPDGALMLLNQIAADLLHFDLEPSAAAPASGGWRLRRLVQKTPLAKLFRSGGQPDFLSDPLAGTPPATPALSGLAATLLSNIDLARVSRLRHENGARLAEVVTPLADWHPFWPMDGTGASYRLVMRCASTELAEKVYLCLRQARLPVESWPDLAFDHACDPVAVDLRRHLLFLPCHQTLRIERAVAAYAQALKEVA